MKRTQILHESEKFSRVLEVKLKGKSFSTPTYFPAISSYGIKFSLWDSIYFLTFHKFPRVLVSAYDLHNSNERKKLLTLLKKHAKKGFLYLDSGIYESSWKADPTWDIGSYKTLLSQVTFDLYSSFDIIPTGRSYEEFRKETFHNVLDSCVFMNNNIFIPIIHGSSPEELIGVLRDIIAEHSQLVGNIGIPERDCGKSVSERATTIIEARRILNEVDDKIILHILGCGNPLSMLLYSYCGADIFDSLDWLKYVINPKRESIEDFAYLELLNCDCKVCSDPQFENAEYSQKTVLHNLLFYQNFVIRLQSLIRNNNIKGYLQGRARMGKILDELDEL